MLENKIIEKKYIYKNMNKDIYLKMKKARKLNKENYYGYIEYTTLRYTFERN